MRNGPLSNAVAALAVLVSLTFLVGPFGWSLACAFAAPHEDVQSDESAEEFLTESVSERASVRALRAASQEGVPERSRPTPTPQAVGPSVARLDCWSAPLRC